jgi:uncharacterized protein YchJ
MRAFSWTYQPTSKRRFGAPSETRVKRGLRKVHGDKYLVEKLGRKDPCPCGSGRRFREVLSGKRPVSTTRYAMISTATD